MSIEKKVLEEAISFKSLILGALLMLVLIFGAAPMGIFMINGKHMMIEVK